MTIFLLEDEYPILKGIESYLLMQDYSVETAMNGLEAYETLTQLPKIDIFILDINVPGLNGLELLEKIRTLYPITPVMMISSDIAIDTIEKAYLLGCSDYLKKPFHIKELDLKIRQITHLDRVVKLSDTLSYDSYSKQIIRDGMPLPLTKKEMIFFELLISEKGKLVSIEKIEEMFWQDDLITSDAIRSLVKRLRQKIGSTDLITTVNGVGYKLNVI